MGILHAGRECCEANQCLVTVNAILSTNVLTAYLKNSVTSRVEPLSVIACRFACFDAMMNESTWQKRRAYLFQHVRWSHDQYYLQPRLLTVRCNVG